MILISIPAIIYSPFCTHCFPWNDYDVDLGVSACQKIPLAAEIPRAVWRIWVNWSTLVDPEKNGRLFCRNHSFFSVIEEIDPDWRSIMIYPSGQEHIYRSWWEGDVCRARTCLGVAFQVFKGAPLGPERTIEILHLSSGHVNGESSLFSGISQENLERSDTLWLWLT